MAQEPISLKATLRAAQGKGASRRARASGEMPAIVYGPGAPGLSVTVSPKELTRAMMGPLRRNALLSLDVHDGSGKAQGKRLVMLKDLQIHPVKRVPTHADFLEVKADQEVAAKVPVEVTGKSKAVGQGAKMQLISRTVTLGVKPTEIPEKVLFDVTDAGFGVIRAKQISAPAGTRVLDAPETPIISLKIPRGDKEEAAAPTEGAAAAAAAPAAAGAKAPAGAKAAAPAADAKPADKKK